MIKTSEQRGAILSPKPVKKHRFQAIIIETNVLVVNEIFMCFFAGVATCSLFVLFSAALLSVYVYVLFFLP